MKNIKLKYILLVTSFMSIVGVMGTIPSLQVDAVPTTAEVYNNAPDGLNLNNLIDIKNYSGGTNSASLISDYPVNIIELLNADKANNQIGSFWGKKYSDSENTKLYNSFRLDRPQTISAWLYFGDTYHTYPANPGDYKGNYDKGLKDDLTSDGMALVLQDDDRGAAAISTAIGGTGKGSPSYGETLGVWAGTTVDHTPLTGKASLYDNIYTSGIQNSFAFEMDAVQNYKKPVTGLTAPSGKDDYFDASSDVKGQHLAIGYPGDSGAYTLHSGTYGGIFTGGDFYYAELNKLEGTVNNIEISGYGTTNSNDVNNAWRHLTFHYDPPTSTGSNTASYKFSFNDQNIDGTATGSNIRSTGKGAIDLGKLNTKSNNIRWGFTASTGSAFSAPKTYAVVMQQMPNTANVENTAKLYDMSQYDSSGKLGREIIDLNQDGYYNPALSHPMDGYLDKEIYNVANNDKLLFQYDLKYDSGTMNTGDIKSVLHMPKNINFKAGLSSSVDDQSIGKVVYSGEGSDSSKSFEISASDITTDAKSGDQVLNMDLPDMDTEGQKATIYLYGQANATTTPQLVDGEPISYRSNNFISDVTTPVFIINDQLNIASDKIEQDVASDEDVTLNGTINYVNNSAFDNKAVQIHTTINGKDIGAATANTTSGATTGSYTMAASNALSDGSPLKIGKNIIEVYATDSLNRVSNKITYTVNVKDYKDLKLVATGSDSQTVKVTDPITLTSDLSYTNGDNIDSGTLKGYFKVDAGEYTSIGVSGNGISNPANLHIKIPASTLLAGTHTITFYVSDGKRDSNPVEYKVIVNDKELILTPDSTDLKQTVHDNSNVRLNGSYAYADNSDFTNKITSVKYQIINADGTKQAEVSQNVTDEITDKGDFTVELEPIGAKLFDDNSQQSVDDYLKTATGLKVGLNKIDVTAYDGDTASNLATYEVNVPDITPSISATKAELTAISNLPFRLPMTFTYPTSDSTDYLLQNGDLAVFTQTDDNSDTPVMTLADRPKKSEDKVKTPYKLNPKTSWTEKMAAGDYKLNAYVMDRYLRKTNTVNYTVKVLPTGAQVEVDDYRFKTIDPRGNIVPRYVQRDGNWDIKVDSYKSKWKLQAQADNMKRQDESGNYSEISNLQMVQLSDDSGTPISLSENPTIASGDSTDSENPVSYSIFGDNSDPNTGILLGTRGVPLSGEYQSTVTWSMSDAL